MTSAEVVKVQNESCNSPHTKSQKPCMLISDYDSCSFQGKMSLCIRKPTIWVPTPNFKVTETGYGLKKKVACAICVAKTKMLIRCIVTAQLICTFVFVSACCWFSYVAAHMIKKQRCCSSY